MSEAPAPSTSSRFPSVDLLRGAVMVLMAIDHVRVYSGLPAGGPNVGIFFTRWITHFCAPAFIFLAGTSAFLYGRRHADLSKYLLTRGAWLVLLELTVIRFFWTFNVDFAHYELAGVIWVIGLCMIAMAGLVKLPLRLVGWVGIIVVALHNLLDGYMQQLVPTLGGDLGSALWKILYVGFFAGPISAGPDGPNLLVLYSFVPWIGVMMLGYAFGNILTFEPTKRDELCLRLGLVLTGLFVVLRSINIYGDPRPWSSAGPMPAVLSFLNTTKYPASLQFLLMTLGPCIALIPWLERVRGGIADRIALFGRVPFFYYLLHIPLIHLLAIFVSLISTGSVSPWLFANHPMGNGPAPEGYTWELGSLYIVWVVSVTLLYFACRWYTGMKSMRTEWWWKFV